MTRDQVLEQAAMEAERTQDCREPCDHQTTAECAGARIRALKSKPPEKSPEVASTLGEMLRERVDLLARLDEVESERDALKAQLATQEKRADEAEAMADRLEATLLTAQHERDEALARVKHMEWVMKGAPMEGEDVPMRPCPEAGCILAAPQDGPHSGQHRGATGVNW